MDNEKLIFDNQSSQPLYESIKTAYDFYFDYYDKDIKTQAAKVGDFVFIMTRNKASVTIKIFDKEKLQY